MKLPRYYVTLISLMVLAVSGCARLATMEKTTLLEEAVKFYVKAVRWNRLDVVQGLLRKRDGTIIATDLKSLRGLQVTHYDYSVNAAGAESGEALMSASFQYYFDSGSTLKTVEQKAMWWWDAEAETWFMDGPFPTFER